jgi:hypothetical protein
MDRVKSERIALTVITFGFLMWGAAFIYKTSFVAFDGRRYFSLFDDAMISMRYAWNFSHGWGLVWNPGEYVQGYTNLLMTLVMSLAALFFDKSNAALSIQGLGIFTMLGIAFQGMKLVEPLFDGEKDHTKSFVRVAVFFSALAYYPLAYWSLMGMETGLLTLLFLSALVSAFDYVKSQKPAALRLASVFLGLAFLTRNDSLIFAVLIFAYIFREVRKIDRNFWGALAVYFFFVAGQLIFQYWYYGELLPNTYTLKLTGMPLAVRLENGLRFTAPFLIQSAVVLFPAFLDVILGFRKSRILCGALILSAVGYQVYVGGDAWLYWRMVSPVMPLVFILFIGIVFKTASRWNVPVFASLSLVLAGIVYVNWRFIPEIRFKDVPFQVQSNRENVFAALALNDITTDDATVAVFWAGALPYYADRFAIDPLGKSDRYIAHLLPDISGTTGWNGMTSIPGHNKYDLDYSIVNLRPVYVQYFQWGSQDLADWAEINYVRVKYEGVELNLLKDSPAVLWDKVNVLK